MRRSRRKVPRTKFQVPKKNQLPITKDQTFLTYPENLIKCPLLKENQMLEAHSQEEPTDTTPPVETARKRLVVEVGSEAIPAAFEGRRGIREGEYYASVNTVYEHEKPYSAAAWEAEKYREKKHFSSIMADAKNMPFPDGTVDELIFNNIFSGTEANSVAFLKESSRVLVAGGEIHITEMNTPGAVPEKWFVGGRPDRKSSAKVEANADYFRQFGLRVKNLSINEDDIREYRQPFPGYDGFYSSAFTLTL